MLCVTQVIQVGSSKSLSVCSLLEMIGLERRFFYVSLSLGPSCIRIFLILWHLNRVDMMKKHSCAVCKHGQYHECALINVLGKFEIRFSIFARVPNPPMCECDACCDG